MNQTPSPRKRTSALTERHEDAAALVADGELTNAEISARVGISERTLARWKNRPDFAARVEALLEAYRAAVRKRGIAVRERRIDVLNDRWMRLRRIIQERAEDKDMASVPGGKTGLLVKTTRVSGPGTEPGTVEECSVDAGLLKELREHEKQAAQELGQWVENHAAVQVTKAYVTVGPDEL